MNALTNRRRRRAMRRTSLIARATASAAALAALGGTSAWAGDGCATVDLTGCGCVNVMTVAIALDQWGTDGTADFNGDLNVDGFDIGYLLAHFTGAFDIGPCLEIPERPASLSVVAVDDTSAEASDAGYREITLYLEFDDPAAVLLSVFDVNLSIDGADSFIHNDLYANFDQGFQVWLPAPLFGGPCECDTYFTIGVGPGGSQAISGDPNLVAGSLKNLPDDVGWFSLPTSGVGQTGSWPDNAIPIAHLVLPASANVSGSLEAVWRADDEFGWGTGSFSTGGSPSDLNGDGAVNGEDLGILLAAWGNEGPGDINNSGGVDAADLGLLLGDWTP